MSAHSHSRKAEHSGAFAADREYSEGDVEALRRAHIIESVIRRSKYVNTYKLIKNNIANDSTEDLERLNEGLGFSVQARSNPRIAADKYLSLIALIKGDLAYDIRWNPFVNTVRDAIRTVGDHDQRVRQRTLLRHCRANKVLLNLLCTILANGCSLVEIEETFIRGSSLDLLSRAPMTYSRMETDWICALLQVARDPAEHDTFVESMSESFRRSDCPQESIEPTRNFLRVFCFQQNEFVVNWARTIRHPLLAVRVFAQIKRVRLEEGKNKYNRLSLRDYAALLQVEFKNLTI